MTDLTNRVVIVPGTVCTNRWNVLVLCSEAAYISRAVMVGQRTL